MIRSPEAETYLSRRRMHMTIDIDAERGDGDASLDPSIAISQGYILDDSHEVCLSACRPPACLAVSCLVACLLSPA